ncbi:MAG: hypothetical protein AAGJ87_06020, partial [Pseudomonadota bacterium]
SGGAFAADEGLAVRDNDKSAQLVEAQSHPDLFVAERRWDDKKARYETEITVETIRKLTAFLNRTASMGGWRVAIVDKADELNRNAANALLKALEEPPKNTVLMLVCDAPGRIIATIRSRCRRLDFRPLDDAAVVAFLRSEGLSNEADNAIVAAASGGRPGRALTLSSEAGVDAVAAANAFLAASPRSGAVGKIAQGLAGKAGDEKWPIFRTLILDDLAEAARNAAIENPRDEPLANAEPAALLAAWEALNSFIARGEALNLDRLQMVHAMHRTYSRAIAGADGRAA